LRAEVQAVVDHVNEDYGASRRSRNSRSCHDLSRAGTLTPTLKVQRNVVNEKFDGEISSCYSYSPPGSP